MTQQDLRKENWLKVIFCIAQVCPCLGFYGGSLLRFTTCSLGYPQKPLKLADFTYYGVNIKEKGTKNSRSLDN